ncbi:MAG: hypothetical protein IKV64_01755 [Clostridia bacterium]|nr:hypothetical protein [Clostridia bacterium]
MFFTKLYENITDEEKEELLKTLFLETDTELCARAREEYYSSKLKHMGQNVKIGTGVKFVNPEFISIGDNVIIMDDVTIIARGDGGVDIGDNCYICERVYLDTESKDEGYIKIGNRVYIGTGTVLFGHKGLEIGDNCLFAQNITLTPYSHIFDNPDDIIWNQGGHSKKVTIGKDCYIGMGVCIMYSGDIGDGSVIGSGALVAKPIPAYSVAVGVPAKPIKRRE